MIFVPIANIVVWILAMLDLAKAFGRTQAFAIGLILLSGIFLALIGFGEDPYQGTPAA